MLSRTTPDEQPCSLMRYDFYRAHGFKDDIHLGEYLEPDSLRKALARDESASPMCSLLSMMTL